MATKRTAAVLVAATILGTAWASGTMAQQGQEKAKAQAKDAFNKFEPRSAPGAGQAYLKRYVGTWAVKKTFHPRNGQPTTIEGDCRQTMVHDGRFLQSDFTFRPPGSPPTEGRGLIGWEPDSGLFTSIWTDSRQTRMSLRRSKEKFDGQKIVLFSATLDAAEKDPRRSKTISTIDDKNLQIIHRQYSLGANNEERLVMELVMTKK